MKSIALVKARSTQIIALGSIFVCRQIFHTTVNRITKRNDFERAGRIIPRPGPIDLFDPEMPFRIRLAQKAQVLERVRTLVEPRLRRSVYKLRGYKFRLTYSETEFAQGNRLDKRKASCLFGEIVWEANGLLKRTLEGIFRTAEIEAFRIFDQTGSPAIAYVVEVRSFLKPNKPFNYELLDGNIHLRMIYLKPSTLSQFP